MKVLFLTSSFPRSVRDSASIFLQYLAEALANRGVEVQILAPADSSALSDETINHVRVHRFNYFLTQLQSLAYGSGIIPNLRRSPLLWLQVPFFIGAMLLKSFKLVKNEHCQLIHAHWILPQGLIAVLIGKWFRVPTIVSAHGTDAFGLSSGVASMLKRWILRHCTAWTTNTNVTAKALDVAEDHREPSIIPMGVDVARFASGNRAALREGLSENDRVVLFIGRLIMEKGCHHLLTAVSQLKEASDNRIHLWIVGDGNQRIMLERNAENLGIASRVRFWGQQENSRLPDFYAAADLFVMPSIMGPEGAVEGQGVVLLEAMAAKTCIIASRLGGIETVIDDGINGILVTSGKPSELSAAIDKLIADPARRAELANNAFIKAARDYGWDRIASEFHELYNKATAE